MEITQLHVEYYNSGSRYPNVLVVFDNSYIQRFDVT